MRRCRHLSLVLFCLAASCGNTVADWRTEVGWDAFNSILGPGAPDGSGVLATQVEADGSGSAGSQIMPNPADSDMSGKTITAQSLIPANPNSNHALTVAKRYYGNTTSMAPGVTDIHVWEAGDYLANFSLLPASRKVHSNAWIADFSTDAVAATNLATIDSGINSKGFLVVGGLNNSSGTSVPHLFATTYNAISVGRSDGQHSRGGTSVSGYGAGRVKPEIVLPDTATSWSTGGAAGLAAVLYEVAGPATSPAHPAAFENSAVIKAIMMAGATKQEFNSWDRTLTRPIDDIFGAGEANILNSYRILNAGQQTPGPVGTTGWAHDFVRDPPGPGTLLTRSYDFTIPAATWADDFSVILSWNYTGTGTPRDLKLELFSLDGGTTLIDESDSPVDNVEHIYQRNLPAGSYRLTVSRPDTGSDELFYGLAWEARLGTGPATRTTESVNNKPEITITNIFKDRPYIIERTTDFQTWTTVHSFTPTTWDDYVWEDPAGYATGNQVFYRAGFTP